MTGHTPYDVTLEQAVLGTLLVNNRQIEETAAALSIADFYDPLHQRLFDMIGKMASEGTAVTPLLLHAAMKSDAGLQEVHGIAYLAGLAQAAPVTANLKDWCRILRDLSTRRGLIGIGNDIIEAANSAPHEMSSGEISSRAMDAILELGADNKKRTLSAGEIMGATLAKAERWLTHGEEKPKGVTTGLARLDKGLGGGLIAGDRVVIAARSGMGKSALAGVMARASAERMHPTLVISADMNANQWANRTLSEYDHLVRRGVNPVPYWKLRTGQLTNLEIEHLAAAHRDIAMWPLVICDEGNIDVAAIRMKARAMAKKYPNVQGRLVVDFLQKIEGSRRRDERRDEEITKVAYGLGDIVKDIGWDLIALAQMKNKDTDANGKIRETPPNVADIRESGGIEQAADIVFTIFRKAWFIERREPEGKSDAGGPSQTWLNWRAELSAVEHDARIIGYKNRDASISKLSLDLWCSMGVSAIRDEAPSPIGTASTQAGLDFQNPVETANA